MFSATNSLASSENPPRLRKSTTHPNVRHKVRPRRASSTRRSPEPLQPNLRACRPRDPSAVWLDRLLSNVGSSMDGRPTPALPPRRARPQARSRPGRMLRRRDQQATKQRHPVGWGPPRRPGIGPGGVAPDRCRSRRAQPRSGWRERERENVEDE